MKKIFVVATLAAMCAVAFAGPAPTTSNTAGAVSQQQQQQSSSSVATSAGGSVGNTTAAGGTVSGVTSSGTNTNNIGCLVNCTDTTASTKALADSTVQAAAIAAQAAETVAGTTQIIKNTPSMNGPNLTSSNDTCMGSVSAGGSGPGFGLSVGKTYTDTNCVRLKNSRELWNMGMKGAALALMCMDDENKTALELTGFECPQTTKARGGNPAVQKAAQAEQSQYTDPIVRARLGLDTPVASK